MESSEIICPRCGNIEGDYSDFVTWWGEESVEFECSSCGAKLICRETVVRTWEVTEKGDKG